MSLGRCPRWKQTIFGREIWLVAQEWNFFLDVTTDLAMPRESRKQVANRRGDRTQEEGDVDETNNLVRQFIAVLDENKALKNENQDLHNELDRRTAENQELQNELARRAQQNADAIDLDAAIARVENRVWITGDVTVVHRALASETPRSRRKCYSLGFVEKEPTKKATRTPPRPRASSGYSSAASNATGIDTDATGVDSEDEQTTAPSDEKQSTALNVTTRQAKRKRRTKSVN